MWSREMNAFLIRCYYVCTRLETDKFGRPRMMKMLNERFPRFTAQLDLNRLYTWQRATVSHIMFTSVEVEYIKLEVRRELWREWNGSNDTSRSSARPNASFASERRASIASANMSVEE